MIGLLRVDCERSAALVHTHSQTSALNVIATVGKQSTIHFKTPTPHVIPTVGKRSTIHSKTPTLNVIASPMHRGIASLRPCLPTGRRDDGRLVATIAGEDRFATL